MKQTWLTLLNSNESADIVALITAYPEFRELYQDIAAFRTKPKELITKQAAEIAANKEALATKDDALASKDAYIAQLEATTKP